MWMAKMKVPPTLKRKKKIPLEKASEAKLKKAIAKIGGISYKFSSMQRKGVSDQIVIIYGRVFFIEMKREGKTKLSPNQVMFFEQMNIHEADRAVVSGNQGVIEFMAWLSEHEQALLQLKKLNNMMLPPLDDIFK